MKLFFIIAFIIVYVFFGTELGYTASSPWYTHITYMFQHANLMHLLLNSISFWLLFRRLQQWFPRRYIIIISMLSAFSISYICYYNKPVIGASGMVYAMVGIYFHKILIQSFKAGFRKPLPLFIFVLSVVIMLGMSFSHENSAAMLHLLCLIAGFVGHWIIAIITKYVQ